MKPHQPQDEPLPLDARHLLLLAGGVAVALFLMAAVYRLPAEALGLREAVMAEIDQSGARNPVTAVLLNFRSYDTLLEIAVLVLALLGVLTIRATQTVPGQRLRQRPTGAVLSGLVRVLTPFIILVGTYLLWIGTSAPGGAFQAGAVLAAAAVLLLVSEIPLRARLPVWMRRVVALAGLAVFLAVAVGVMAGGRAWLEYPVEQAGLLILVIETASTLSIAAILAMLFAQIAGTAIHRPEAKDHLR